MKLVSTAPVLVTVVLAAVSIACGGSTPDAEKTTDDAIVGGRPATGGTGGASGESATVEGELQKIAGSAGAGDQYGIQTADGPYELTLDDDEARAFAHGRRARVSGALTTIPGMETAAHRLIDVRAMLVCPAAGTLNCMPRPNEPIRDVCAKDNWQWVAASCPGVDVVF